MNESINCKNCGTKLNGTFCYNCGEKIVTDNDFSVLSLLKLSFSTITNFDSKFFKSFRSLLFNPGHLTDEFILGKRKSYIQPFQIFVLANLFFFFFLTSSDVFRNPSQWFFKEAEIKDRVENLSAEKKTSQEMIALEYDNKSTSLAKSAIIIIIPFFALAMMLINIRKKYLFGKHLIYSTHFLSFLMIFMVLLSFVISVLPFSSKYLFQIPIFSAIFAYLLFSQKSFYNDTILISLIKSAVGTVLVVIIILIYRAAVSFISLWLIV